MRAHEAACIRRGVTSTVGIDDGEEWSNQVNDQTIVPAAKQGTRSLDKTVGHSRLLSHTRHATATCCI